VSEAFANLSERQLWLGVTKLILTMTGGLLIVAFLVTILAAKGSTVSAVTINALIISVAVSILANGLLAVVRVVDWFEARRSENDG
jgi:phosphoglycerol transferase MdoB-like AlkP superfamily enzyme